MNWFHKFFNPHCPHCTDEKHEEKVCASCETLKLQLEITNHEKEKLLERLFPAQAPQISGPPVNITPPRNIPWRIRQQMLEGEDRKKAELLRTAPKPQATVEDLEKELGVEES